MTQMEHDIHDMLRKWGRMVRWVVALVAAACCLGLLLSCRTKRIIEREGLHDTVRIAHADTVLRLQIQYAHDTLRLREREVVTLSDNGDTIRVNTILERDKVLYIRDTLSLYHTRNDSAVASRHQEQERRVYKPPDLRMPLVAAFIFIIMAFVVYKNTQH